MEIATDADGRLRIRAVGLGPQELDRLIHQLAEVRTTMEPEIPRQQEDAVDAVTFTAQDDPEAYVTRDADGRVSIGLRHAGFGWIAFAFTDADAASIWEQLGHVLGTLPGDVVSIRAATSR
ncbi:MAG: hypothetical protein KIT60_16315 [Burkholderiaceae bacterium]|nr:hypothetical protein [Burkholderiaceae bacterium]